jgi:hypothetical protein
MATNDGYPTEKQISCKPPPITPAPNFVMSRYTISTIKQGMRPPMEMGR